MEIVSDVKTGIRHPKLVCRKLNQLYYTKFGRWEYNKNGIDVFEKDWDSLVILDACRADMIGDELFGQPVEKVESRGSGTIEFLRGNVGDRDLTDTVYITANPQLYRNRDDFDPEFHKVINIWAEDGWEEEYGTVLPETVYDHAIKAADEYPNKRLLIHFIQPHHPFITYDPKYDQRLADHLTNDEFNLWMQIMMGNMSSKDIAEIINGYHDNLSVAIPYVKDLVDELLGKTIVTSDHGNLLGERVSPIPITEWGHPLSLYVEELVSVPWVEFESDQRREITAEKEDEKIEQVADEAVKERLRQLGYK